MSNEKQIIVISGNNVFSEIIKTVIRNNLEKNVKINILSSLTQVKETVEIDKASLIIVDDVIQGTSAFELIRYLRMNLNVKFPIYYFSIAAKTEEYNALARGASTVITKPFSPEKFIDMVKSKLN